MVIYSPKKHGYNTFIIIKPWLIFIRNGKVAKGPFTPRKIMMITIKL